MRRNFPVAALVLLAVLVLLPGVAAAQVNPCTATDQTLVINPTEVFALSTEHTVNEANGTPRITSYDFAIYPQGTNPNATPAPTPLAVVSLAKSAFTAVSGAANCYRAAFPLPLPGTAAYVAAIKSKRAASAGIPAAESPWTVSQPFSSVPTVLAAVGLRVGSQ